MTEKQQDKEDKGEFRCMYCNCAALTYESIVTYLPLNEQYGVETPYGDFIWIEEESEEGYRCHVCGSHCSVEEVYWWYPDDDEKSEEGI